MIINKDDISILKIKSFRDNRGYISEVYNKKKFKINFLQDNFSSSKKNVLRGFHGDYGTWKLISCIFGKVQFSFINYNKKSKNYKKNTSIIVEEKNNLQILIPPKFGTAHLVLSKKAIIHYKQSSYYRQFKQFTINYKSDVVTTKWKAKTIITSERDKGGIFLNN